MSKNQPNPIPTDPVISANKFLDQLRQSDDIDFEEDLLNDYVKSVSQNSIPFSSIFPVLILRMTLVAVMRPDFFLIII